MQLDETTHKGNHDSPGDMDHKKIGGTAYEIVSNYIGNQSLLDIIRGAIRRDVENGNY
jgi:hypothetical protein